MKISSIHFVVNETKPDAHETYGRLSSALVRYGMVECASPAEADAIIALGGDGTILRAFRSCPGKPVAGFNIGTLGYLSCVERKHFDDALAMLSDGRFKISERTMLSVRKTGSERGFDAANDVVLTRELSGHAGVFELTVNSRPAARYVADGLVFATPTGSTAYSLAAGGPVVMPDSMSFVVTPMNPHALGVRPMVVNDSVTMRATVSGKSHASKTGVYVDGENAMMLAEGESVEICKSNETASLIEFEGYDPYDVLARKLGWCAA